MPDGTVVSDGQGTVLADLVGPGTEMVIAEGGRRLNAALASSKRKAPWPPRCSASSATTPRSPSSSRRGRGHRPRRVPQRRQVQPDRGAVPGPAQDADYPFTTLVPNLGVVTAGETTFTVADVPGLIEGASEGRGLGHDFLRHVERCAALVRDRHGHHGARPRPALDLDVIERELGRHGGLEDRPRLVVLNKVDVPDGRDLSDIVLPDFEERGLTPIPVSAASHEGLRELSFG